MGWEWGMGRERQYLVTSFSLLWAAYKQAAGGKCEVHPEPALPSLPPLAAIFAKTTAASGRSQVDQGCLWFANPELLLTFFWKMRGGAGKVFSGVYFSKKL